MVRILYKIIAVLLEKELQELVDDWLHTIFYSFMVK